MIHNIIEQLTQISEEIRDSEIQLLKMKLDLLNLEKQQSFLETSIDYSISRNPEYKNDLQRKAARLARQEASAELKALKDKITDLTFDIDKAKVLIRFKEREFNIHIHLSKKENNIGSGL